MRSECGVAADVVFPEPGLPKPHPALRAAIENRALIALQRVE
jgi:hypothetical protein